MKTTAIIITGVLLSFRIFSQDLIYTTDGRSISAKVLEIGTAEVKYKSSANQDGPVYVMNKSDINSIKYENGTEDVFTQAAASNNTAGDNKVNGYNTDPDGVTGTASSNNTYASSGGYNNGNYNSNRGSNLGPLLLLAVGAAILNSQHHSGNYCHSQRPYYTSHSCGSHVNYGHHR
jgi:hypothetical protein